MRRSVFVVFLTCTALVAGCTWNSYVRRGRPIELPENAPREIRTLIPCQPVSAVLDCGGPERECNHWWRVDVMAPGELRVRLRFGEFEGSVGAEGSVTAEGSSEPEGVIGADDLVRGDGSVNADGSGELTRVIVRPLGLPVLGQAMSTLGEPVSISVAVVPDVHGVLVQGAGARRSYELWAAIVEPGTPENASCPAVAEDAFPDE